MNASDAHNAAILPMLRLITDHAKTEADQWVILETLCLGIGKLHGRSPRDTAIYIERWPSASQPENEHDRRNPPCTR